jgi:hypothetical protein
MVGIAANGIGRITTHSLRRGGARDVTHLPIKDGSGFVSGIVRQALRHSMANFNNGATERYAGDLILELWNR